MEETRKTETELEKSFDKDSPIRKLVRMFRTNTVTKHHKQGLGSSKPQGVAKSFFKNSYSYNTSVIPGYTAYERMARYSDYCLTGDTLIATNTVEGFIRIDEIVSKFNNGEDVFVFAYDHNNNKIVLQKISNALLTKQDEIFEIHLDNGEIIKATGNHKFMLRDGTYREAQDLVENTALMPFSRNEYSYSDDKKIRGSYRAIYQPKIGWRGEHIIVAEYKNSTEILKDSNKEIHHINFIRNDNRLENLVVMEKEEHRSYHANINNLRFSIPENRKKQSEIAKKRWADGGDLRKNKDLITEKRKNHPSYQKEINRLIEYNKTVKPGKFTKGKLDQTRFKNTNCLSDITFQTICDNYTPGIFAKDLAKKLKIDRRVIINRIQWAGYKNWSEFTEKYTNHKVVKVVKTGRYENVYDITVPTYHNFALKSGIFVHNCEAESFPIIGKALQIYADETTQRDENGKIITVISSNTKVQDCLQDLFDNRLHLNGKKIYKIARDLCKYGDDFQLIDITTDEGVVNLIKMPPSEVEREEGYDKKEPTAVRFRWVAKQNTEIPNAFVAHFRLDGNDMFWPYGSSVLEAARRPWKQMILLEDSMMIYRITRSAERRVFFFDIGGIATEDVDLAINKFNETIKKKKLVNDRGQIDLRYGATMDMVEDFLLPVRDKDSATRIETLPGGQNIGDVEDVKMIEAKLFAALGIPKAFLTYDEAVGSKQVLTHEDIRFSRTVQKIQEAIINELVKIGIIHLYIKGFRGKDLYDFKVRMTNPSTISELQKIELWRARLEAVQAAGQGVFDTTFIYKNFLRLSDEAIDMIRKGQIQDKIFQTKLMAIESAGAGGMPGGMQGGAMGGGGLGGLGGAMGGMGGADMGLGLGGAPMGADMGGAPPAAGGMPAVPMEGFNPAANILGGARKKDLSRRNSNERIKTVRGQPEDEIVSADDVLNSPGDSMDSDGIRRDIESPFGMKEHIEDMLSLHLKIKSPFESSYTQISATYDHVTVEYLESLGLQQGTSKNLLTEHIKEEESEESCVILPEQWEKLALGTPTEQILKENTE